MKKKKEKISFKLYNITKSRLQILIALFAVFRSISCCAYNNSSALNFIVVVVFFYPCKKKIHLIAESYTYIHNNSLHH